MKNNINFTQNLQQNVAIVVKRLDIYGGKVYSQKEFLISIKKNLEHRGVQIVTALEVFTERSQQQLIPRVTILKQDLDNQQQQNKQVKKDNDDLRIYLEKLEKNYKKMEEQIYELIEEKEQLSHFEIDLDEDIYS